MRLLLPIFLSFRVLAKVKQHPFYHEARSDAVLLPAFVRHVFSFSSYGKHGFLSALALGRVGF